LLVHLATVLSSVCCFQSNEPTIQAKGVSFPFGLLILRSCNRSSCNVEQSPVNVSEETNRFDFLNPCALPCSQASCFVFCFPPEVGFRLRDPLFLFSCISTNSILCTCDEQQLLMNNSIQLTSLFIFSCKQSLSSTSSACFQIVETVIQCEDERGERFIQR
jgi:hypothetical protein